MAFLARSGKFTVYDTQGQLDFATLEEKLLRFRPIDDEATEEGSIGFVCFDDYLQPLGNVPMQKGVYFAATIRLDVRKIPGSVFKKYFRVACEEEMKVKQIPKLSRVRKNEIKENTRLALLRKTLPQNSLTDVIFDAETGRIYLCSASAKMQNFFIELMEESYKNEASCIKRLSVQGIMENNDEELGIKFMNWCFYRANHSSDTGVLFPGTSVSMCSDNGSVSVTDPNQNFLEALKGIASGKGIIKATFSIPFDNVELPVSISEDFTIGIKTPKLAEIEEGDEPDKPFFEKLYFVQKTVAEIENLVNLFSNDFQEWGKIEGEIIDWASEG